MYNADIALFKKDFIAVMLGVICNRGLKLEIRGIGRDNQRRKNFQP